MSKRYKMSPKASRKMFKRGVMRTKSINTANPMRGGIRL